MGFEISRLWFIPETQVGPKSKESGRRGQEIHICQEKEVSAANFLKTSSQMGKKSREIPNRRREGRAGSGNMRRSPPQRISPTIRVLTKWMYYS
jgi:hypothetical protein